MRLHDFGGPHMAIETDRAAIALGNSERSEVGEALANALIEVGFENVETFTLNQLAIGGSAVRDYFRGSFAISHSHGIARMPNALQVLAFNPSRELPYLESILRAQMVGEDPVDKEPEAHETGIVDLLKAGLELARSPRTTLATMRDLNNGFNGTMSVISRRSEGEFPAGSAMVHSFGDKFGFPNWGDMMLSARVGITTGLLYGDDTDNPGEGAYHNGLLFAPRTHLDAIRPIVEFPTDPSVSRSL